MPRVLQRADRGHVIAHRSRIALLRMARLPDRLPVQRVRDFLRKLIDRFHDRCGVLVIAIGLLLDLVEIRLQLIVVVEVQLLFEVAQLHALILQDVLPAFAVDIAVSEKLGSGKTGARVHFTRCRLRNRHASAALSAHPIGTP